MAVDNWPYVLSGQFTEPPAAGQIRMNNATPNATTKLWIAALTVANIDVWIGLMSVPVGGLIYVQNDNDHTRAARFTVNGPAVDKVTYVEIPVGYVGATTQPLLRAAVAIVTSDKGQYPQVPA